MTEGSRLLIEDWLPVDELGIEAQRERAFVAAIPDLFSLHVWWARRPLVASAGVILASLLPVWSEDLAAAFPDEDALKSDSSYKKWFIHLCGIWGDPVAARVKYDAAVASGVRIPNPYPYKQAYKNRPSATDLGLLHRILERRWGAVPTVLDPTAGGGSIPYEASRYGLPTRANDLNQVAAATLRGGVEIPSRFGVALADDLDKWGQVLAERLAERLRPFFPSGQGEKVATFLFARSVACPRTGKPVPLAPNWWISKSKGQELAAHLIIERDGRELTEPEFELLSGKDAVESNPDQGSVSRGNGLSPWDGLVIDGDYIKAEAQAGRMGSVLYAVAIRLPKQQANGKTKWVRAYRAPTQTDRQALTAADEALTGQFDSWLAAGILPREERYLGFSDRSGNYGVIRWTDMFSPRQLLVHGAFVEEFQAVEPEIRAEETPERATAILGLLGLMQGKALNWNSVLSSWNVKDEAIRSVFDRHDFSFKWSYAEFEGADALWTWVQERSAINYRAIAQTMLPEGTQFKGGLECLDHPVPALVNVSQASAGDLSHVESGSQTLVCIDPPYYDNVMYGELSDFFGVWEQHTVGRAWPDVMPGGIADLKNEAVANPARFKEFGRRRNELANADYEAKMQAIFW